MDDSEPRVYSAFENADLFFTRLDAFLAVDVQKEPENAEQQIAEYHLRMKLEVMLLEYQEQPFLLDPHLERMVAPPVNVLRKHISDAVNKDAKWSQSRVNNLFNLIYAFCRVRGHKAIVRFFPHEVADLPIALSYMSLEDGPMSRPDWWSLRFVMLLWMSLICMVPFDLYRFDGDAPRGTTLARIEALGKKYIGYAGIEREMAAIMLARLYTRADTVDSFIAFLAHAAPLVGDADQLFTALGMLKLLCEYCGSQSADRLLDHMPTILDIANRVQELGASNSSIRKLRLKLITRVSVKLLPPPRSRRRKARGLLEQEPIVEEQPEVDEFDVPEEVESAVADALQLLEDKDTQIRWSAAKAVSHLAERLPRDFVEQIFEQILGIFDANSWKSDAELLDLPPTAEYPWHGACLACAEFTRRDLLPAQLVATVIPWIVKALHFDIRKGAHSIGSSVRDAASYVLWSLARSQDLDALAEFTDTLARELVVTAIYDREVHIRRAASAAFQENVGRTGLFPDGIAVLAKVDFFTVGVRRSAFTIAAADVAKHPAYQKALVSHVLGVVLQHWDLSMRQSGAESLKAICAADPVRLGSQALQQLTTLLASVDIYAVNGGLLGLSELALLYTELDHPLKAQEHLKIFKALHGVPQSMLRARLADLVLEGYCLVLSHCISAEALELASAASAAMPPWRSVVEQSLRSRTDSVQAAAAQAMRSISQLRDCNADVKRWIRDLKGALPQLQQGIILTLGVLAYDAHPHGVKEVIQCLLDTVDSKSSLFSSLIESRQKAFEALPNILNSLRGNLTSVLSPAEFFQIYQALLNGLADYSSDERGDVGSWVRMASMSGLSTTSKLVFALSGDGLDLASYLPAEQYHAAVAGILKQGVERLDNVRQHAGDRLRLLVDIPHPAGWEIPGEPLLREMLDRERGEQTGWADGNFVYPMAVKLLAVPQYRSALVQGFILSIGSKTDSTQRTAGNALAAFAADLPPVGDGLTIKTLVGEASGIVKSNFTANHIVIPALQTLLVFADAGVLQKLQGTDEGQAVLSELLKLVLKNADKIKNVQRIATTMKLVVSFIYIDVISYEAIPALLVYLGHKFPKIRADTAEAIYLSLQSESTDVSDELEELLLETEWPNDVEDQPKRVVELLQGSR